MPTSPFHNKGDARLMQDILTYSPTQPDAQAQADATANEKATAASPDPRYITLQKETKDITTAEALAAWDAGGSIWSVEMGGLGPGYEQCIQVLAVECVRALTALGVLDLLNAAAIDNEGRWPDHCVRDVLDPVSHKLDKTYRFSGAQVGAAMNLACIVARKGYGDAMSDPEIKDRLIQVRKDFP